MNEDTVKSIRVYQRAFSRLNQIHREIASGRFPTAKQLAEICGVTVRTINRDLDVLRYELNAPLRNDRRRKGYYFSDPAWMLLLNKPTEAELLAFFVAENALKLLGQAPEAFQLRRVFSNMIARLPAEVAVSYSTFAENVSFQNPPFELSEPEILHRLAKSATEQTTVEFDYFAQYRGTTERRKVDVYLLHNFGGDWYAIAFDHARNSMRDFHVGRITNLKETNDAFEVRTNIWNKDDYLRNGFNMMHGGRMTTVEILFDSYQAQWIRKRGPFHLDETREDLPDGSLRLKFRIGENALEAVARFCLQYTGNCIAEKPRQLRKIILEKLKKGLEMHE